MRPTPKPPAVKSEPYEKADVKTMAAEMRYADTETGFIAIELFPESVRFPSETSWILHRSERSTRLRSAGSFRDLLFRAEICLRVQITAQVDQRARRPIPDEPNQILHERGIVSLARAANSTPLRPISLFLWIRLPVARRQLCRLRPRYKWNGCRRHNKQSKSRRRQTRKAC